MKRFALAAALAALFAAPAVLALTGAEYTVIQKAADQYLSTLPANGNYHVNAEDVYKRIQSGKNDFVIVDVRVPKDKKYDVGHMPGAIFIAPDQFAKPDDLAKLPRAKAMRRSPTRRGTGVVSAASRPIRSSVFMSFPSRAGPGP